MFGSFLVCLSCTCSVDNLREFVRQFVDGELEPYIKSEPLPEDNSGPVTVSIYHTYDSLVHYETISWSGGGGQEL